MQLKCVKGDSLRRVTQTKLYFAQMKSKAEFGFLQPPSSSTTKKRNRPKVRGRRLSYEGVSSLPDCVTYEPAFLPPSHSEQLMKELMEVIPFRQEEIKIFGKLVKEPRLCAWYGGAYKYSGRALKENPLDSVPQLASLRDRISRKLDLDLNSVLINLYRDGSDYIGWHSDDERELGPSKDDIVVASLSLGAARDFRLKRKDGAGNPISITLESGSLLIMRGETQKLWKHMVPKTKNVQQPRINLTFRFLHQVSTGSPTPKDGQTKRAIVRT
ncbi:hypothetical protein NDN08_001820 [Rhodosorus marinus]|uniref:Fe2OG dioxygenase domain-containing protein n=1 Tax=Rhodosorus marinus TaxID=101924 RepID=A0AAV8US11_9RHOD|nr:hypothetical protein NDN08_001820 [Rhodosorus marinus]